MHKSTILIAFFPLFFINAQNEYVVKTNKLNVVSIPVISLEHEFVKNNFPYLSNRNWQTGMKFIVDQNYSDDNYNFYLFPSKDRALYKNKILTIDSISSLKVDRVGIGVNVEKAIFFNCEEKTLTCSLYMIRDYIQGLIYLGDIDIARKLLIGKTLFLLY